MEDKILKEMLENQLKGIRLSDEVKDKIRRRNREERKTKSRFLKMPTVVAASVLLLATTGFAGYVVCNQIHVNQEELPEIDEMKVAQAPSIFGTPDEDGDIEKEYDTYRAVNEELGGMLLESNLAGKETYARAILDTDNKDYISIHVYDYIIGDVKNMEKTDVERYAFEPGDVYGSPIQLYADVILSEEQLRGGMELDYLGLYEFQEQAISRRGYKVNIVVSTVGEEGGISEKIAVFVANGIRYRIQGCVTTETLMEIVDSME